MQRPRFCNSLLTPDLLRLLQVWKGIGEAENRTTDLLKSPGQSRNEGLGPAPLGVNCTCLVPQGAQFSVVITEGRPDETGLQMARALTDLNIPVIAILDSGVAYAMDALRHPPPPSTHT